MNMRQKIFLKFQPELKDCHYFKFPPSRYIFIVEIILHTPIVTSFLHTASNWKWHLNILSKTYKITLTLTPNLVRRKKVHKN